MVHFIPCHKRLVKGTCRIPVTARAICRQGSTGFHPTENANGATTDSQVRHAASHVRYTARQKRWNIGIECVYIALLSFSGSRVSYAALAFGAASSIPEKLMGVGSSIG